MSQRFHAYAYVIVPGPAHVPSVIVSVCPTVAAPVTAGSTVLDGGGGVTTTAVAAESAGVVPHVEVALTLERIVLPESAATNV